MCLPPPHPILRGGAHAPLPSNKYILKQQREDFVREWGEGGSIGREGQVM